MMWGIRVQEDPAVSNWYEVSEKSWNRSQKQFVSILNNKLLTQLAGDAEYTDFISAEG